MNGTNLLREPDIWAAMCRQFPWVAQERGDIGEGLIHLEFAALRRGVENAAEGRDIATATEILDFVEDLLEKVDVLHPEVINAIDVSFLEDLYLSGPQQRELALALLRPKTRERWQEIADAHADGAAEAARRLRSAIREHLALLADPAKQRDYQREVPSAVVAAELVCGWFDDIYHPESPDHQRAFTPAERATLAELTASFDAVNARLGTIHDLGELQAHSAWTDLCRAAADVLAKIPAAPPGPLQRS